MPLPEEYRRTSFLIIGALLFVGGITLLVVAYTWFVSVCNAFEFFCVGLRVGPPVRFCAI